MPERNKIKIGRHIFTLHRPEHIHKSIANKEAKKLRMKGWNVRVIERKSDYSGLEIFSVYKRRK